MMYVEKILFIRSILINISIQMRFKKQKYFCGYLWTFWILYIFRRQISQVPVCHDLLYKKHLHNLQQQLLYINI